MTASSFLHLTTAIILLAFLGCEPAEDFEPAEASERFEHFDDSSITYETSGLRLGISFPAVADSSQRSFSLPLLKELGVTHLRFAEQWKLREPSKGEFHWRPLDKRMRWAKENGFQVLLTIQSDGPAWACTSKKNQRSAVFKDNADFRNYIAQLLKRYPNQISKIQFGNEWQSEFWYAGSAKEFVEANNTLFDAVQQHSPSTDVVLGGFTTISLRFLTACAGAPISFTDDEGNRFGVADFDKLCATQEFQDAKRRIDYVIENAKYDVVDAHLYDDPEQWNLYLDTIREMTGKPVLVSEFGGPNANLEPTDQAYQANRLADYIKALDACDVEEAYFFKLVEGTRNPAHVNSGLIGNTGAKKASFGVFRRFSVQARDAGSATD